MKQRYPRTSHMVVPPAPKGMRLADVTIGMPVCVRLTCASVDGTVQTIDNKGVLVSLDKWPDTPVEYVGLQWLTPRLKDAK